MYDNLPPPPPCTRPCPVCLQDVPKFCYRPQHSPGPISRCRQCGMTYVSVVEDARALIFDKPVADGLDPKVITSSDLGDVAGSWALGELSSIEADWTAKCLNAVDALKRITQYVPATSQSSQRLLDFGCGWGLFLVVAQEFGWEPYGLEPLPAHAVYARNKFGARITVDVLQSDTFPADFFHAITAFQVFEHLPYPVRDLGWLSQMLVSGGIILIEVPNIDTWSVRLLGARHRHYVQDHLNFFSKDTLELVMRQQGLQVLGCYYPTRHLGVRHLIVDWIGDYLPRFVTKGCESLAKRLGLWEKTIDVNLGDIVAVIAQKPQ